MGAIQKSQTRPNFFWSDSGPQPEGETAPARDLAQDTNPRARGAPSRPWEGLLEENNHAAKAAPPARWVSGAVRNRVANHPVGAAASAAGALGCDQFRELDDADGRFPVASTGHGLGRVGSHGTPGGRVNAVIRQVQYLSAKAFKGMVCDFRHWAQTSPPM